MHFNTTINATICRRSVPSIVSILLNMKIKTLLMQCIRISNEIIYYFHCDMTLHKCSKSIKCFWLPLLTNGMKSFVMYKAVRQTIEKYSLIAWNSNYNQSHFSTKLLMLLSSQIICKSLSKYSSFLFRKSIHASSMAK